MNVALHLYIHSPLVYLWAQFHHHHIILKGPVPSIHAIQHEVRTTTLDTHTYNRHVINTHTHNSTKLP